MLTRLSPNVLGIVLMITSVGTLAALDSAVKLVANEGMHPFQIVFFRILFGVIALLPLLLRVGFNRLKTKRPGVHIVRGIVHSSSMLAWFYAITIVPLADATALSFIVPVYASIGAIVFMGEPSDKIRWLAVVLGLAGMLVILRPGFAEVNFGAWLVVCSAIAVAISKLIAKSLARTDSPETIVFYMSLTILVVSFIPALSVWTWPAIDVWFWLMALGVGGSFAHVVQTHSYRVGDITAVEPASYFRLIWAALFGFVIFGETPEAWTWIGTVIIVTGAIILTRNESRQGKKKRNESVAIASIDHS